MAACPFCILLLQVGSKRDDHWKSSSPEHGDSGKQVEDSL